MNVLDIGVVLVLLMFMIVGFKQGVIRELFAFVGIVVILVVSVILSGIVSDIFYQTLPFFDFKGSIEGMSAINLLLYQVLAMMMIFCILLTIYEVILKLSKVLQKLVNMTVILWLPSKFLGGFVGLVKGYIIVFLILLALIIPFGKNDLYESSRLAEKIVYNTPILSNSIGSITKTTKQIYSLADEVANKKITSNQANLKTIDLLLEHNIAKKTTIKHLIEKGKLTNVDGYEKVLSQY